MPGGKDESKEQKDAHPPLVSKGRMDEQDILQTKMRLQRREQGQLRKGKGVGWIQMMSSQTPMEERGGKAPIEQSG